VVIAHEHIKPLVEAGRIAELLVGMPRRQRRNGGVKGGRISQAGVLVAGGKRAGDASHGAAVRVGGPPHRFGLALFLGAHFARHVYLRPGDVAVHVDAARHDHQPAGVDGFGRPDLRIRRRANHAAIFDPQIGHLAIDAVGGVVHGATGDFQQCFTHENSIGADFKM
jgi:hypothetical protein